MENGHENDGMSFCLKSVLAGSGTTWYTVTYTVLVLVIRLPKYMHMHIWPTLVFKYLFFSHALGFLREEFEYIQDNHGGVILIQMNSEEGNQVSSTSTFSSEILSSITPSIFSLQRYKIFQSTWHMSSSGTEIYKPVYCECIPN